MIIWMVPDLYRYYNTFKLKIISQKTPIASRYLFCTHYFRLFNNFFYNIIISLIFYKIELLQRES